MIKTEKYIGTIYVVMHKPDAVITDGSLNLFMSVKCFKQNFWTSQ